MKPSQTDLEKLQTRIEKNSKYSNGHTEKEICAVIRSAVRQAWMRSSVKLLKLDTAVLPDLNPDTRTKWLIECEHCHEKFPKSQIECDHKDGEKKLQTIEDITTFTLSILDVKIEDLQLLCKECHEIKTFMERYKVDKETAIATRKAISMEKKHKPMVLKDWLIKRGYEPDIRNKETRRAAMIHYFMNN